jgi:hypothetical protein
MPRDFALRYRRVIAGPFAGDPAPAGALALNDIVTGAGVLFRMRTARPDYFASSTFRLQGYLTSSVVGLTVTMQLWISSGLGTDPASDWIAVGDPLTSMPLSKLFDACGQTEDADSFIQLTPSAPLILGDTLTLFQEEVD